MNKKKPAAKKKAKVTKKVAVVKPVVEGPVTPVKVPTAPVIAPVVVTPPTKATKKGLFDWLFK
jgi:hypothetical protein